MLRLVNGELRPESEELEPEFERVELTVREAIEQLMAIRHTFGDDLPVMVSPENQSRYLQVSQVAVDDDDPKNVIVLFCVDEELE